MLKAVAGGGGGGITPGTTVITGGTNTRVLFDDNGVVGESGGLTYVKGTGTLTAPIGVISTSLAIGGASIGSNALAVTGTGAFSGNVTVTGANLLSSNLILATGGINNNAGGSSAAFDIGYTAPSEMQIRSAWVFRWSNSSGIGTLDTSLSRNTAGVLQVGTTAANALGSLNLTNLTATGIITVPGAAVALLTTSATATSGAGAQVGTLTNAPSAGNPTSWLKISDNGVTRYIPAW